MVLEKPMIGGLFNCDIYIPSLDMVIDVHGPVHYLNLNEKKYKDVKAEELKMIDSALYVDRIYRRHHKHYMQIPYKFFDSYLRNEENMQVLNEDAVSMIRGLIEEELNRQ